MKTVVCVGSHPDDVELGMGGTVVKHAERGDRVHLVVCTLGGVSGDPADREVESRKAANILGAYRLHALDYPVTMLNKPNMKFAEIIKKLVEDVGADRLYVHSPFDYHQVHVSVSKSVLKTCASIVSQLLCYEVISSTTPEFKPNAYVEITHQIKKRLRSLEAHKSQSISRFYLQGNVIESLANTRYVWGKVGTNPKGLAEAFTIHKFVASEFRK